MDLELMDPYKLDAAPTKRRALQGLPSITAVDIGAAPAAAPQSEFAQPAPDVVEGAVPIGQEAPAAPEVTSAVTPEVRSLTAPATGRQLTPGIADASAAQTSASSTPPAEQPGFFRRMLKSFTPDNPDEKNALTRGLLTMGLSMMKAGGQTYDRPVGAGAIIGQAGLEGVQAYDKSLSDVRKLKQEEVKADNEKAQADYHRAQARSLSLKPTTKLTKNVNAAGNYVNEDGSDSGVKARSLTKGVTLAPGAVHIDPETGKVVASNPKAEKEWLTVPSGGKIVNPTTGEEIVNPRPEKQIERTVDLGDKVRFFYAGGKTEDVKKGKAPGTEKDATTDKAATRAEIKDARRSLEQYTISAVNEGAPSADAAPRTKRTELPARVARALTKASEAIGQGKDISEAEAIVDAAIAEEAADMEQVPNPKYSKWNPFNKEPETIPKRQLAGSATGARQLKVVTPPDAGQGQPPAGAKPMNKTIGGKPAYQLPDGRIWTP